SLIWFVHSHIDELGDFNAGLLAAIIVYRIGACDINRYSTTVDREFVLSQLMMDEMASPYYEINLKAWATRTSQNYNTLIAANPKPLPTGVFFNDPFRESLSKFTINGYIFGNTPNIVAYEGERVRFYLNA